jgi:hypothetical protein
MLLALLLVDQDQDIVGSHALRSLVLASQW